MKIAVTGTIGAGKSKASSYLVSKGYPVFDTDKLVHQYYEPNGCLYDTVRVLFGPSILADDETIDRRKLGARVFSDSSALDALEAHVFPVVSEHVAALYRSIENHENMLVFFEVPMLFEAHMENEYDCIIMINADYDIRIPRLMKRGLREDDVLKRMERHMDETQKMNKSDIIVWNNDTESQLYEQLDRVLETLERRLHD
ncbi:dephospho-CoA kinase [Erysipelothrix sp. HDW6C]|uniref:dephospho-CoA kinase n=1 Tax=Erysipelothrix sp. HDW6C TaxID=2714930 RepID=UPI00140A198A|nr:dephospho-CoA kinase [Erysipelothrix sp. HDW6C]QIK70208.1 dephospho-CoA kinase [Erysipelothrix sp. HDW6C]